MSSVVVENIVYEDMLYTVAEVATLLKTNPNTVYKLTRSGVLPSLKLGSIKVRKASLEKFLKDFDGKDISDPMDIKEIDFDGISRGKERKEKNV